MTGTIDIKNKLSNIAEDNQHKLFPRLIELGIALSSERNKARLIETILSEAKSICNADGGTLYLITSDNKLRFAIMMTDSLGISMGGTTGVKIPFPPLDIYDDETGNPNHRNIATHVAITGQAVNIEDAYHDSSFDFSGTRKFDAGTGYRSKSFLTVPLKNFEGKVIGVMQLLNARSEDNDQIIPFNLSIQPIIESLASQAAVALDNQMLIENQKHLLEAFIKVIAFAIDRKSRYTGGHCSRVPELNEMIAKAACNDDSENFSDFKLDDDGWYELRIAGWMHDCGKVITPEAVMDKSTKLETIHDRIHEVCARASSLRLQLKIKYLESIQSGHNPDEARADYDSSLSRLDEDIEFLQKINLGGEWMSDEYIERLQQIAQYKWIDHNGDEHPLLSDNEVYNLSIRKGTLTSEERVQINDHIQTTIEMLDKLPFPENLKNVPVYAGCHHEKMDGTGYPRGLKKNDMPLPARMMAIADIFEALTATDRPYKKPTKLSKALKIMESMKNEGHIDPDLFDLFIRHRVYLEYANKFLMEEQIDLD